MHQTPILEAAREYLFTSVPDMVKVGLPEATRNRLLRLRDIYNYWLQFPNTKDRELALYIKTKYELQPSQTYADIRVVKALIGDLQKASKEYHRWRFIEMCNQAYEMARVNRDAKAMVAAADKYAKYTQLDKEDLVDRGFDKIMIQPFKPTDDPSVAGFKPIPNIRERIQKKIASYWSEEVEDVEIENVEYNEDDIFRPKIETE